MVELIIISDNCVFYMQYNFNWSMKLEKRLSFSHIILAKPLDNPDIVSLQFNHFPGMGWICDTLSRHLSMLTCISLNVDQCWFISSIPPQTFKLHIMLTFKNKMWFLEVLLMVMITLTWSGLIPLHWHNICIINSSHKLHAWLNKKL